jgi:hypothetical protein
MSQIKGKQIKDNTLDLSKVRGGSKILPADATLGTLKTAFSADTDLVTKKFVVDSITSATVNPADLDGAGLIVSGTELAVQTGAGITIITDAVSVDYSVVANQLDGNGLTVSGTGQATELRVQAESAKGIAVAAAGISVVASDLAGNGLSGTGNTLSVGAGDGISVSATTVGVNYQTVATAFAGNGLIHSGTGQATTIGVGAGFGITVAADSIAVSPKVSGGITVDGTGVSVNATQVAGTGLSGSGSTVSVNYATVAAALAGNGLVNNGNTIDVGAGAGIAIAGDAVTLNISNYTTSGVVIVESTNASGATYRTTTGNLNLTTGTSNNVIVTGRDARYAADYSTTYTDRSLVDKAYVDSLASGLDPKASTKHATNKVLTGLTYTTTGGGTLTKGSAIVIADIDTGGGTLVLGDRVLVKDQADQKQNGIYVLNTTTTLVRSSDMDGNPTTEVSAGNFTFVETGSFANMGFVVQGSGNLIVNTDNIVWVQFSGAGQITAGSGLSKTGNTISFAPTATTAGAGLVNGVDFLSVGAGTGITVGTDTVSIDFAATATNLAGAGLSSTIVSGKLTADYNVIASALAGTGLSTTGTGQLTKIVVNYATAASTLVGTGLSASGTTLVVNYSTAASTLAGTGLSASGTTITADYSAIGIQLAGAGLTTSGTGQSTTVNVGAGTTSGITVNANDIAVKLKSNAAITVDTNGLSFLASEAAGNGLSGTGNTLNIGAGTGISVSSTAVAVIKPTAAHQGAAPLAVAANATGSTGIALGSTPAGLLRIAINGMIAKLGDGVKTEAFYFSGDSGTTARSFANIVSGDTLYFVGTVAGFELETDDMISIVTVA